MKKYLLFLLPILGYSQAIDLSLSIKNKEKYVHKISSEVSSTQQIDGAQVETKALSRMRIRYTFGKEDKLIYPMTLRYEEASLEVATKVNGKEMPLEKIPDYTNQAAKELLEQPLKGELSTKGKIVKIESLQPLIERAMRTLEKKQAKSTPLTPFEKQQVQMQLEAAFSEVTLQSNLANVLSILPRQRVMVGDSWEISSFLSKEMNVLIKTQYTLVEARGGQLHIKGKSLILTNKQKVILQQGQHVFFTMKGKVDIDVWLDAKTKWIVKATALQALKGETEVEGDLSHQKGKVIPFESQSKIMIND